MMRKRSHLRDKVVVITGASSGIGRATAIAFAREGCRVALAARREEDLEDTARLCREAGGSAIVVPTDVSQEGDVQQLARTTLAELGRIDVWVNNAGVTLFGLLAELPFSEHIVALAARPRREVLIPRIMSLGVALHWLLPRTMERLLLRALARWHFETRRQLPTQGNLRRPPRRGDGHVHGRRGPRSARPRSLGAPSSSGGWRPRPPIASSATHAEFERVIADG